MKNVNYFTYKSLGAFGDITMHAYFHCIIICALFYRIFTLETKICNGGCDILQFRCKLNCYKMTETVNLTGNLFVYIKPELGNIHKMWPIFIFKKILAYIRQHKTLSEAFTIKLTFLIR